ncbi:MAG: T9SS type A sorting domain-containing protein [Gemmatimonadetes bacterium]|nr:T9SS type A sorting domain-containing protein [Gemmatimonadota bacterium]
MLSKKLHPYQCKGIVITILFALLSWTAVDAQPNVAVDLSLDEEDVRILGAGAGELAGYSLATGDINADGFDDIVIGARESSPGGRFIAGAVYLVLGSASLPATVNLANASEFAMVIQGADAYDRLGTSVAVGDVNMDSYDDIIVGASTSNVGSVNGAGKAYLFYGGPTATLPAIVDLNASTANVIVQIWGSGTSEGLGTAVASGDLNGDGYDDMIVSAGNGDGLGRDGAGRTHVVFGKPDLGPNLVIDLSTGTDTTDITIVGSVTNDEAGAALSTGDIDADGYDDLLIGAPSSSLNGGSSGGLFVVFGGSALSDSLDLAIDTDMELRGETAANLFGFAVESDDFNQDGYDDILVGAPGWSTYSGRTYVFYGGDRPTLPTLIDLSPGAATPVTPGLTVTGPPISFSGRSLTTANFDGDGFTEIITGAPLVAPGGRANAGAAYGVYGGPLLSGSIDLTAPNGGIEIYGDLAGGVLAYLAMSAGDINGDGVEDVILTAPGASGSGHQAGEVAVVFGEIPYLEVSITTASSTYNLPLTVAATIDSTSGMPLVESVMEVSFNSDLLTVTSVTPGALTPSWTVGYTICMGPGAMDTLKVSASTTSSPADSTGEFLQINFWVNKLRYAISAPVTIELLTFNGNETDFTQSTPGPVTLLGNDGDLAATLLSEPGDVVRVRVTDVDLNIDPANIETFPVILENRVTGEQETVVLTEQSVDDLVFFGALSTAFGTAGTSEDGTLHTQSGEEVSVVYTDPLSLTGPATAIVDTHRVVVLGDADGSGSLQAYDSALILSHAVNHLTLVGLDSLVANLDIDAPESAITAFDAALAIQRRLGLISSFPVQGPTSKNHPQPETTNNPKPVVEERYLALASTDDYISVRVDARDEILAADLLLSGIEGRIEMGPEMELFEVVYVNAEDGLHVAFAGPRAVEGAGELFRIYPTSASAEVRDLSGHFNGGRIAAYLGHGSARSARPLRLALHPNRPNPFNPETLIRFDLPTAQTVSLDIFNALGQKVRTLVQGRIAGGIHNVRWDSRDEQGQAVATGPYFYRLSAGSSVQTQRMMLVK